jgi:serine phosphatase RsbU (regulator of sigma subunit)
MVGVPDPTGLLIIKLKFLVFTVGGLVVAAEVYERDLIAMERARLEVTAAAEHRVIERLQRLLLPPERMSGRDYAARGVYVAATSGLGVGGDWYDVAELPDGRLCITVGDVVGHGAEAAAAMSRLKAAIGVLAPAVDGGASLLSRLDEVAAAIDGAGCATVWVGYFDPSTGCLRYASAGHPPCFLLTSGGVVHLDGAVSAPILVHPGLQRLDAQVDVEPGARLLLYTDGLIERRGELIDRGLERVADRLEEARRGGVPAIDALEDLLVGSTDDIVLFEVTLRPSSSTVERADPGATAEQLSAPESTSA